MGCWCSYGQSHGPSCQWTLDFREHFTCGFPLSSSLGTGLGWELKPTVGTTGGGCDWLLRALNVKYNEGKHGGMTRELTKSENKVE